MKPVHRVSGEHSQHPGSHAVSSLATFSTISRIIALSSDSQTGMFGYEVFTNGKTGTSTFSMSKVCSASEN